MIAEALGVSSRTVRRALVWLRAQGFMHELVPGCRVPEAEVPEDETADERAAREADDEHLAVVAAAAAAREAAHQALVAGEMAALRAGLRGADAAAAALARLTPEQAEALAAPLPQRETRLLQVVPVYELRVPLTDVELAEDTQLRNALWPVWTPAPRTTTTSTDVPNSGVTCGDTEIVHPPQNLPKKISSTGAGAVDKERGASRRIDQKQGEAWSDQAGYGRGGAGWAVDGMASPAEGESNPDPDAPPAAPVQRAGNSTDPAVVARWLARSALDPRLVAGEDLELLERWLRRMLRATGLLSHDGWDGHEVRELLHGRPVYPNLPYDIASPRAFLRGRFADAQPLLPPTRLAEVHRLERGSRYHRERRLGVYSPADPHRVEMAARRVAIEACELCDEQGWISSVPDDMPVVRCNHDPDTGGW